MKSADMLQSFSYVCRMFHFEAVVFFSMFLLIMSPILSKQTQTMKRQTMMNSCHVLNFVK